MKAINKVMIYPVLALFLVGAGGCASKTAGGIQGYEAVAIRRGSLEKTVSASGSIEPVSTVNVLARMSGKVEKIYVDYNDPIQKGDVLAELNTDMLRLQREQQAAAVVKARANYELQLLNYQNQEKLAEKNLISEYELKTGRTTLEVQAAELAAAAASLAAIETEINQYALIVAPIDGIVLERNLSVGDTVVDGSSSNSSSLFTLAENLEEMRIEAGVGELDISSIYKGQEVRFTLEALPGKTYAGFVEALHLVPAIQDNVVSYTVIIAVDNRDGALFPGMTCAVEFIAERNEDILLVPNAALRYQPTALSEKEIADRLLAAAMQGMGEEERAAALEARSRQDASAPGPSQGASQGTGLAGLVMPQGRGMGGGIGRGPPGGGPPPGGGGMGGTMIRTGGATARTGNAPTRSVEAAPKALWFLNGEGKLDCLLVRAGISDGSYTEVRPADRNGPGEAALEGLQVILRERI
jgi:HlyD family secretion protein